MAAPLNTGSLDTLLCLDDVVGDPRGVARNAVASGVVFGLTDIDVRMADKRMAVFWLTLQPWAPMAARGYPTERVSVAVWPGGRVSAVPLRAHERTWYHRYPYRPGDLDALGELCLWYPEDPRTLRWEWDDGFVEYLTIVHRHLQAEEYYRRHRVWPSEDAPHGPGPHPITTEALSLIVTEGST